METLRINLKSHLKVFYGVQNITHNQTFLVKLNNNNLSNLIKINLSFQVQRKLNVLSICD